MQKKKQKKTIMTSSGGYRYVQTKKLGGDSVLGGVSVCVVRLV